MQINPLVRKKMPTSTREIMSRVNEITFNSRADGGTARHRIRQPADRPGPPAARHRARTNTAASTCTASCSKAWASGSSPSKLRNDYDLFELLRKLGQRAARRFLDAHFDDIGVHCSVDLQAEVNAEWA